MIKLSFCSSLGSSFRSLLRFMADKLTKPTKNLGHILNHRTTCTEKHAHYHMLPHSARTVAASDTNSLTNCSLRYLVQHQCASKVTGGFRQLDPAQPKNCIHFTAGEATRKRHSNPEANTHESPSRTACTQTAATLLFSSRRNLVAQWPERLS